MENEQHKVVITTDLFVLLLIKACDNSVTSFKKEVKIDLNQDVLNTIYVEYLILYVYFLDGQLRRIYTMDQYGSMLGSITGEIAQKLDNRDARLTPLFSKMFNERFTAHAAYKYFALGTKGGIIVEDSRKNTISAFSQWIAKLLNQESLSGLIEKIGLEQAHVLLKDLENKGISINIKYKDVLVSEYKKRST